VRVWTGQPDAIADCKVREGASSGVVKLDCRGLGLAEGCGGEGMKVLEMLSKFGYRRGSGGEGGMGGERGVVESVGDLERRLGKGGLGRVVVGKFDQGKVV